jgi:hypothetical protein
MDRAGQAGRVNDSPLLRKVEGKQGLAQEVVGNPNRVLIGDALRAHLQGVPVQVVLAYAGLESKGSQLLVNIEAFEDDFPESEPPAIILSPAYGAWLAEPTAHTASNLLEYLSAFSAFQIVREVASFLADNWRQEWESDIPDERLSLFMELEPSFVPRQERVMGARLEGMALAAARSEHLLALTKLLDACKDEADVVRFLAGAQRGFRDKCSKKKLPSNSPIRRCLDLVFGRVDPALFNDHWKNVAKVQGAVAAAAP